MDTHHLINGKKSRRPPWQDEPLINLAFECKRRKNHESPNKRLDVMDVHSERRENAVMQEGNDWSKEEKNVQRSVRKVRLAKATITPTLGNFESRSTRRIRELKEKAMELHESNTREFFWGDKMQNKTVRK